MRSLPGRRKASKPSGAPSRVARVRDRLQDWFARGHRDLPWRRTTEPYAVWVSEVMLQQTRVETVVPYYERFLVRFPDVGKLAAASQDELFRHWAGLGYYRRAANLHRAARAVVERHAGRVPGDEDALLALPGVGRYTAGAIRSIAFGAEAAIVDGNVVRVLARVFAIGDLGRAHANVWEIAGRLVRGARPSHLNQGLMELGALVCRPAEPTCEVCPVRSLCEARARGRIADYPPAARSRVVPIAELHYALVGRANDVLLVRRSATAGRWAGLWDLPGWETAPGEAATRADVERELRARLGARLALGACVAKRRHVLTHRDLRVSVWAVSGASRRTPAYEPRDTAWVRRGVAPTLGTSALVRKLLAALPPPAPPRARRG